MAIEKRVEGDTIFLRPDAVERPLRPLSAITEALGPGVTKVVIDLAHIDLIDSLGLGELVEGHHRALDANAHLRLVNVPAQVHHFFLISHMAELLEIEEGEPVPSHPPQSTETAPTPPQTYPIKLCTHFSSREFEARVGEQQGKPVLVMLVDGAESTISPGKAKLAKLELIDAPEEMRQALREAGYRFNIRGL